MNNDYKSIPEQFVDPDKRVSYKLLLDVHNVGDLYHRNMSQNTATVYWLLDKEASDTRLIKMNVYDIVAISEKYDPNPPSNRFGLISKDVFQVQHAIWKLIEAGFIEIVQP